MSDHELETASLLPIAERETLVLRYWRRGALTPLALANSLARRLDQAPRSSLRPSATNR
jgi:hypothetical protein